MDAIHSQRNQVYRSGVHALCAEDFAGANSYSKRGICLIPTLSFLVLIGNDRRIMRTPNRLWENFWIGAAAGGLAAAGCAFVWWKLRA